MKREKNGKTRQGSEKSGGIKIGWTKCFIKSRNKELKEGYKREEKIRVLSEIIGNGERFQKWFSPKLDGLNVIGKGLNAGEKRRFLIARESSGKKFHWRNLDGLSWYFVRDSTKSRLKSREILKEWSHRTGGSLTKLSNSRVWDPNFLNPARCANWPTSNLSRGRPAFFNPLGRGEARVFARSDSGFPRATLGFKMMFRPGMTQDLNGEPIDLFNQTKIDFIDQKTCRVTVNRGIQATYRLYRRWWSWSFCLERAAIETDQDVNCERPTSAHERKFRFVRTAGFSF
jgi:hypothetical protein